MPEIHEEMKFTDAAAQKTNEKPSLNRCMKLTWTIRSISQRVPLPLRRTSSGDIGIIVAKEKMNGWT